MEEIRKRLSRSLCLPANRTRIDKMRNGFRRLISKLEIKAPDLTWEEYTDEDNSFNYDFNTGEKSIEKSIVLIRDPMCHYQIRHCYEKILSVLKYAAGGYRTQLVDRTYILDEFFHKRLYILMINFGLIDGTTSFQQFSWAFSGDTISDQSRIQLATQTFKGRSSRDPIIYLLNRLIEHCGLIEPTLKGYENERARLFTKVFCNHDASEIPPKACYQNFHHFPSRKKAQPAWITTVDDLMTDLIPSLFS